jgi:preprotein translocase subunit Sss1
MTIMAKMANIAKNPKKMSKMAKNPKWQEIATKLNIAKLTA